MRVSERIKNRALAKAAKARCPINISEGEFINLMGRADHVRQRRCFDTSLKNDLSDQPQAVEVLHLMRQAA